MDIKYTKSEKVTTLFPSVKKIILKNICLIDALLLSLIAGFLYLQWIIGDIFIFMLPLELFNIKPTISSLIISLSIIIFLVSIAIVFLSYQKASKTYYEFYSDKVVVSLPAMIIFSSTEEIPFENIQRITVHQKNFIDTVFGFGTLDITLSGLKKEKIELIYVRNPEQWASWLTQQIQQYTAVKQQETLENMRLQKTFDREW